MSLRYAFVSTDHGKLLAVMSPKGLRALLFVEPGLEEHMLGELREQYGAEELTEDRGLARQMHDQVVDYLAGKKPAEPLKFDPLGTPFQQAVWQALRRIPHGQTRSYMDIAEAVGSPRAVRAVGQA